MRDLKVKHDYTFKRPTLHVKDAGTWKPVKTAYVNNGDVWKPVWTARGAQTFTGVGTFTVPAGVYSICALAISAGLDGSAGEACNWDGFGSPGAGGPGGDGGSLAYKNNIAVTPGQTFSVCNVSGQVNFGSLYVLNGRAGVSAGWDISYLGGIGGLGQPHSFNNTGALGFAGGGGGQTATWVQAGSNGVNAPGGSNFSMGGYGTDLLGVYRSASPADAGNRSVVHDGGAGAVYGGGGGGGSGQTGAGGAGPFAGGLGAGGAVRIIWGTGKSYPDTCNF